MAGYELDDFKRWLNEERNREALKIFPWFVFSKWEEKEIWERVLQKIRKAGPVKIVPNKYLWKWLNETDNLNNPERERERERLIWTIQH